MLSTDIPMMIQQPPSPQQELQWSAHVLDSLFSQAGIKAGTSLALSWFFLLFGDNFILLFVLMTFLVVDFITGAAKAVHLETFNTAGLRRGAVKIALYLVLLILGHLATFVSEWLLWFDDAVYCYIALTEYESISENLTVFGIKWPSIRQLRNLLAKVKGEKAS